MTDTQFIVLLCVEVSHLVLLGSALVYVASIWRDMGASKRAAAAAERGAAASERMADKLSKVFSVMAEVLMRLTKSRIGYDTGSTIRKEK